MEQNTPFERITIEPAINGYVITIEDENSEKRYVYSSLRVAIRELKKIMNTSLGEDE